MDNSRLAYSEIYEIINLLDKELLKKIPANVINFFKEERDCNYIPKFDDSKPLEEQIRRETVVILYILTLNYWCKNEQEKKDLLFQLNNGDNYDDKMLEKYNIENLLNGGI